MHHLLDTILLPYRTFGHRRLRNQKDIEQFLLRNCGTGKIFGLHRRFVHRMLFVSAADFEERDGKHLVVLDWFEPSGAYISTIRIQLSEIESICPLNDLTFKLPNLGKFFADNFSVRDTIAFA